MRAVYLQPLVPPVEDGIFSWRLSRLFLLSVLTVMRVVMTETRNFSPQLQGPGSGGRRSVESALQPMLLQPRL